MAKRIMEIKFLGVVDGLRGVHQHVEMTTSLVCMSTDDSVEGEVTFTLPTALAKKLRMDDELEVRIVVERNEE